MSLRVARPHAFELETGNLTYNDRVIIGQHPLSDSLDYLREFLQKIEQTYAKSLSYEKSDQEPRIAISQLLFILWRNDAALELHSKTINLNIRSELWTLICQAQTGYLDYEHYRVLSQLVIEQAPDVDIWSAVIDVIARTRPAKAVTTPPPSGSAFSSTIQQTPCSFNSGSFIDTSEQRTQVNVALKQELLPNHRLDIPDFIHNLFGWLPQLHELADKVFQRCQDGDAPLFTVGKGWAKWPPIAREHLVLDWLQNLTMRFTELATERGERLAARRQLYRGPLSYLEGSPIKRKMDVGIGARHRQSKGDEGEVGEESDAPISNWTEILIIGELKRNPTEDGRTPVWLDLATYAREVFRTQDRRFVLGFTLCGPIMRLWQFDRSGSSGSLSFDINKDGFMFTRVMLGYYLMNDEQLGLDPTIQQLDDKRYVNITREGQVERLILTKLIKKQAMIVGRATTCWVAYRDGDKSKEPLIVKDSWQYEKRPEEGEILQEATQKGVRNVARYYHHETVQIDGKDDDVFENVRRGFMKSGGRTLFTQKPFIELEMSSSQSLQKGVAGPAQAENKSQKRSISSAPTTLPATKRPCSSFGSRDSKTLTHNRIRRRVITRDAGRSIENATSLLAVINGLIGAIKGHESLLNAGILHRDISNGNIILTEQEDSGFLIDLDLAVRLDDNTASGAPSKTGTKVFMAIGALKGEHHNSMHDLESFFWVLYWVCVHWDGPYKKRRKVEEFEGWNLKSTGELAKIKSGLVLEDGFLTEMSDSFSEYCKPMIPCVQKLWKEVFPGGHRWLREDRELYSRMVAVLVRAREGFADKSATL